ncbi:helix-turn-helix domain-containing protein [Klebsiella sp. BIGb0407]|uniref:helix-turn-helix domain-containing protein n=1 Tax=Klebsiella sp. BIGb0407 TaxID=2940603 RepID=UPI002167C959|nr:helix-turn-helix domain-containing protein [Klebsiella sp. BIGb0407]MCS3430766.1 CheY-like chemotaxis protein [Klebsiella sp. BIGb0407]
MHDADDKKLIEVLVNVLVMKGIPKIKHNSYISQILKITTSASYKKLTGSAKWEVQQLINVIESLGMNMSLFFDIYAKGMKETQQAVWSIGGFDYECKIQLYPENSEIVTDFSAMKINEEWHVLAYSDIKYNYLFDVRRGIESITVYPKNIPCCLYRIALLDDDTDITRNLKNLISGDFYSVDSFECLNDLHQHILTNPYDAYVLDWVIGSESSFELIKTIRKSSKNNAMIIVLTGQLAGIKDDEISKAIHDYDIVGPFEKPIKPGVIISNIDKHFRN